MPTDERGEREVRRHAGEADAERRERHAHRHQPGQREAVRERAERGLDDRRAHGHEQQKGADRAVGISAFRDQERDQRGHGALAEIRDRVA